MNPGRNWCRVGLSAVAMLVASLPAFAQVVPPSELPGRERPRFEQPAPPLAQPGGPAITLPGAVAPPGADKIKLILRGVRTTGGTIYRPEELAALYGDLVGRNITLAQVYDIAARITAKYGGDGYVLSRAIIPPQELAPGGAVVLIQIVEGYIDRVEWPASLSKYRDFFADYTAKITANRPTNIRTLERYLLLAGDLPGLKFKNSLKASATQQGAATLVVEVIEKPVDFNSRADNRGTKARGPYQFLTSVTANNLLRIHEAFTVTYAGAFTTSELRYIAGAYRQVLTSEGLSVFATASNSRGRPGTPELRLLEYMTDSQLVEAGVSYPFIRLRERNLIVSGLLFYSDDQSDILGELNTLDRLRGARLKLDADLAEQSGAINQLNVVFSQGIEGFGSSKNGNLFLSTGNGRVDFTKVEATYTRVQPLFWRLSLLVAAYGQYAATPLLAPEQCGYGGRAFGRAFDPSELVADSCLELLAELRLDLPHSIKGLTQAQLYGFVDRGWLHNLAPVLGTPEHQDAASVGGGIRFGWQPAFAPFGGFSVDLSAAKGIDGPRDDWRFFFIATGRL
jgi:hemolysin activation/secretion protein